MTLAVPIQPTIPAPEALVGRQARCQCGAIQPSSWSLAFFEFRGEGSNESIRRCANCGYYDVAHETHFAPGATLPSPRYNVVWDGRCPGFVSKGAAEFDGFYCGCRGWE